MPVPAASAARQTAQHDGFTPGSDAGAELHPTLTRLFRDSKSGPAGLSSREARRRLLSAGRNELTRHRVRRWPAELARQLGHPLALLLWLAALLAAVSGTTVLALAIVAVVLVNAGFAFVQEQQAERAVDMLTAYLPATGQVLRDGRAVSLDARSWFLATCSSSARGTASPPMPG